MIRYFLPIFLFINTPLVASESYSFAGEWIVTEEVYSAFTKPEINRARVVRIDFNNPDKCMLYIATTKGAATLGIAYKYSFTGNTLTLKNMSRAKEIKPMQFHWTWIESEEHLQLSKMNANQGNYLEPKSSPAHGIESPRFFTYTISLKRKPAKPFPIPLKTKNPTKKSLHPPLWPPLSPSIYNDTP